MTQAKNVYRLTGSTTITDSQQQGLDAGLTLEQVRHERYRGLVAKAVSAGYPFDEVIELPNDELHKLIDKVLPPMQACNIKQSYHGKR